MCVYVLNSLGWSGAFGLVGYVITGWIAGGQS